jgi:hypothetical protein
VRTGAIAGSLVVAAVFAAVPVLAHHSFAGMYVEQDTVEIEGDVVQFQYKNPHVYLFVAAQDPFGMRKVYTAEWQSVSRLETDGITATTIRPGDHVRIWGSPGRNADDHRIRLKRIRLPDGRMWGQGRQPDAK